MEKKLEIYTFGKFHITDGFQVFSGAQIRSSKIWKVLKYLIAFCGKPVSSERLIEVLWPEDSSPDPAKSLRDIIYRLRKALVAYGGDQSYILYAHDSYQWNSDIECYIDVLEFDKLLIDAHDTSITAEEKMGLCERAAALYKGPFLGDFASDIWTLSFTNHYRRLFLQTISELVDMYDQDALLDKIINLLDSAIACEPCEESLFIWQIQALTKNGEYAHAKRQYRNIEKILMREFGAQPSNSLRLLFQEIENASAAQINSFQEIKQRLEEESVRQGAALCGPETFRQIYALDKRSDERIRFPVFLVLITMLVKTDVNEREADAILKSSINDLRQILLRTLRGGDIVTQYSRCQFILMLSAPDEASGNAALHRVKSIFERSPGSGFVTMEFHLSPIGKEENNIYSKL